MPRAAQIYIGLTAALGVSGVTLAVMQWHTTTPMQFLIYFLLAIICSRLKIRLPGITSTLSVNYVPILLSIMTLSYAEVIAVSSVCILSQCMWRARVRPQSIHLIFNLASGCNTALVCCLVHQWWRIGTSVPVAVLFVCIAYFFANTCSVAGIVALTEGKSFIRVWMDNYFWTAPQYLVGGTVAALIQVASNYVAWQWALLILPSMYLIYRSYQLYLSRLEQEKRHVSNVSDLHLRTIEALAMAIEAKDEATHDHLRRVQVYAVEIAKEIGVSEDQMQALKAGALLHDIGKLAVPEYILSKPGRLTPEEFERIKIHPTVGAEILKRAQFPYPVAPIVAAHHEKWDGTGYPLGLRGEEIPIGARILTVVDCLDALASDRQYRPRLPLDKAMEEVASLSGTSFDPRVVDILRRRYVELERMAHAQRGSQKRLSKEIVNPIGLAPAAGFEQTADKSEVPNFTSVIAAARQEFTALYEVTAELGNTLRMEDMLYLFASHLRRVVPHDTIAIYIRDHQNRLIPQHVSGADSEPLARLRIPMGQGLSGWVAENEKPIINGNPAVECGYWTDSRKSSVLGSALAVPLVGVHGVIGVLTLYCLQRNAFTRDHLRLLLAISAKAARTIENAMELRQAKDSAMTDALTGLPNASSLFAHLDLELTRCQRSNTPLAVLVLDLDGFKQVNDQCGHLIGNRVLQRIAAGFRDRIREYDYVARMGGDEFVMAISGMEPESLRARVKEFSEMVACAGAELAGQEVSVSIGDAWFPADAADAQELLAMADKRMYAAKRLRKRPHFAARRKALQVA